VDRSNFTFTLHLLLDRLSGIITKCRLINSYGRSTDRSTFIWDPTATLLTWGPETLGASWLDFRRSVYMDGEKITTLFSLTPNWNLTFQSIIKVGNKVIYDLKTPKILLTSINFTVSILRI
jgi:hypothetical protein